MKRALAAALLIAAIPYFALAQNQSIEWYGENEFANFTTRKSEQNLN